MNITGISASSQFVADTGPACVRLLKSPWPNEKPIAMKSTNAATFSVASTLLTSRPGPTPRRWIHAIPKIAAIATMLCGDDAQHERAGNDRNA